MSADNSPHEGLAPLQRSKLLEESDIFANIHADAANSGQTTAPSADVEPPFAFTCFIRAPSPASVQTGGFRLLELNGARDGPVDRGDCENLLKDVAKYVREVHIKNTTDPKFSMLALGPLS